jgi:hypothetical protein
MRSRKQAIPLSRQVSSVKGLLCFCLLRDSTTHCDAAFERTSWLFAADFALAVENYSKALKAKQDPVFLSNRAAAYIALRRFGGE